MSNINLGAETTTIDDWLMGVLTADPVIISIIGSNGAYSDLAPEPINYPFIVFTYQAATDVVGVGPHARIMTTANYVVRGISEKSFSQMKPLAQAIDAALDGKTATLSEGNVISCTRNSPFRMTEQLQGRVVRHLGGTYSINVQ